MNYRDLDINQRINLKGLFAAWARITIERFQQKELGPKVYSRYDRSTKSRVARQTRTGNLRRDWRFQIMASSLASSVQISFPLYGRFVDMGVGNGVDYALSRYARKRANGETLKRKPKRWYSKRKAYETHRLRELMVRHYVNLPVDLLENALSTTINLTV